MKYFYVISLNFYYFEFKEVTEKYYLTNISNMKIWISKLKHSNNNNSRMLFFEELKKMKEDQVIKFQYWIKKIKAY